MTQRNTIIDGWREVIAPLSKLVDLDETARASGALLRRREIKSGEDLLHLAVAWSVGGLSLRQAAAWAGISGVADLCDSALLRRLRKAAAWLEGLVRSVVQARATLADAPDTGGRPIRLVDGSTVGVVGSDRPGWRLHTAFDLPSGRIGGLVLTPASEGEGLERLPVAANEVCIADRGFARPEGLRHVVDHDGDFLVRAGSRSLKLEVDGKPLDWMAVFAAAGQAGLYDGDARVLHGRKSRKRWPPLPVRLIVKPLPPEAAEAARLRLRRAGQREGYTPSALAMAAAGYVILLTSLERQHGTAEALLALYRLRWQIELAFKRWKSLLAMRSVPTKDPDLAKTWLYAHLLIALLTEDFGAELAESSPSAP